MINITSKDSCCGCSACYNICSENCIVMSKDEEDFFYPKVDVDKCINCGLCKKVCPMLKTNRFEIKPNVYACKNKNENIRFNSHLEGLFQYLLIM